MVEAAPGEGTRLERLQTGIAGLDTILGGGLVGGGSYLIEGLPGTGKTTLANQLAFHHARGGGRVVYVTFLGEPHDRMLAHLAGFRFFERELVGERVQYINLYESLIEGGLAAALEQLRDLVRRYRAGLLLIDGAGLLEDVATSGLELRRFFYDLDAQLGALGCTAVALTTGGTAGANPIRTYVDGILTLEAELADLRNVRYLRVEKLRGSAFLEGRHVYSFTRAGIEVYPRLESLPLEATPEPPAGTRRRVPFGIAGLDAMLHGGLLADSTTLIVGTPGAGKTTAGLHFVVEGARRGEPGLIATFHEPPERLVEKAAGVGLDLAAEIESGRVHVLWLPPLELIPSAWARDLLALVDRHRPRRLFLDSLIELERMFALTPARFPIFAVALARRLVGRGVTTLAAADLSQIVSPDVSVPILPAIVDNSLHFRYVDRGSRLHRLVSIIKLDASDYDSDVREFRISARGIEVAASSASAEEVLSAEPSPTPRTPATGT